MRRLLTLWIFLAAPLAMAGSAVNNPPTSGGGGGGVTSIIAGTGISVNGATGDVTVTATGSVASLLIANNLGDVASAATSRTNLGVPALTLTFVTTQAESSLTNSFNLGGLATGVLQQVVSAGIATPSVLTLTQGAVPFGASNGTATQNASLLFWNDSTHALGVGTNTPGARLTVQTAGNGASAIDVLNTSASAYTLFQWKNNGVLSQQLAVSQAGSGNQIVWWKGTPGGTNVSSYIWDEVTVSTPGVGSRLATMGGLGLFLGDSADGSVNGVLEIQAKTNLSTQTAIALSGAYRQDVLKSAGTFGLGTSDAHSLVLETNGTTRMTVGSTGTLTLNSLASAGFVTTDSSGNLSISASSLSGLTSTDVLYATSATAVGQDNTFSFNSGTHVLSAGQLNTTIVQGGSSAVTVQDSTVASWLTVAAAGLTTHGNLAPTTDATYDLGASSKTWKDIYATNFVYTSSTRLLTLGTTVSGHDGSLLVNSGSNGLSIGGGTTAGIYIADPLGAAAASIAVDDYLFAQALVGYTNLNLSSLAVGTATGHTLSLSYLMDRDGAHTDALTIDGTGGEILAGGSKPAFDLLQGTGGNAADVMLGYQSIAAGNVHGYPYMPTIAGLPTGAAASFGSMSPFAYDSTHRNFMVRDQGGGQWQPIPPFIQSVAAGSGTMVTSNVPTGYNITPKYWFFKDVSGTSTVIPFFQP